MEVSNNSLLNILLPQNNKVLNEVLKNIDNTQLKSLLDNKNLSTQDILKNIFEQIKNPDKSNTSLLNTLKNSNFFKDLGSFSSNISTLISNLKSDESLESFANVLKNFAKDIKDIDAKNLESQVKNSGVFLESKLSNPLKYENKSILDDLKTVVLKLQDEISKSSNEQKNNNELKNSVERVLTQIETSQMYSILSNSNYVYVPFLWDMLEDGSIEISNTKDDDFYCKINVTLKEYGKIELTLGVFDEMNFEVYANFENNDFKEIFKNGISQLKDGFSNQGINIQKLRINDLNEQNEENHPQNRYNENSYDKHSDLLNQINIKA